MISTFLPIKGLSSGKCSVSDSSLRRMRTAFMARSSFIPAFYCLLPMSNSGGCQGARDDRPDATPFDDALPHLDCALAQPVAESSIGFPPAAVLGERGTRHGRFAGDAGQLTGAAARPARRSGMG